MNIFVQPPGDLIYYVLVIVICLASLTLVLGQRVVRPNSQVLIRYSQALMVIGVLWSLVVFSNVISVVAGIEARAFMPVLERAVQALTILFIGWAFLVANLEILHRSAYIILFTLGVFLLGVYFVSALQWVDQLSSDFNLTVFNTVWTFVPLVLAVGGAFLSLIGFARVHDAPLKMVFFSVLIAGYGYNYLQIIQENVSDDFTGVIRLTFVVALIIMLFIVFRAITSALEAEVRESVRTETQPVVPVTSDSSVQVKEVSMSTPPPPENPPPPRPLPPARVDRESAKLLKALGMILEEASPTNMPMQIIKTFLEIMRADIGALLRVQDANYADIVVVYDRSMQRTLTSLSLNLEAQPTLVNAIERQAQRPLFPDRNHDELEELYTRLDLQQVGPAYFQPLRHNGEIIGILLIALPYTKRELDDSETEMMKGMAVMTAGLLALSYQALDARLLAEERAIQAVLQGVSPSQVSDDSVIAARFEMQENLRASREQILELSKQVSILKIELDRERNRVAESLGESEDGLSVSQEMMAINAEQQQLREERDQLLLRLQEAEAALNGVRAPSDNVMFEEMIQSLEREREDLLRQKETLEAQIEDLRENDGMIVPGSIQNVIERMSDDKAQLEIERDELKNKLQDIQSQLKVYGIEDGASGLAHLISKLYEHRSTLQARNKILERERKALLADREKWKDKINHEHERDKLIETLQTQVKHIAEDREAAIKQRDQYRRQRDEMNASLESVKQHRTRVWAQASALEMELKDALDEQARLRLDIQKLSDERSDLLHSLAQVMADKEALTMEREQLLGRMEGDRDRVRQVGEEGIGSLQAMITDISGQRNELEQEVNRLRTELADVQNDVEYSRITHRAMIPTSSAIEKENGKGKAPFSTTFSPDGAELLIGLVQEMRTPMTSVVGYIELLLGESVGILGEMQRKFLQRVSSNVTRLATMINDLIRLTELDTGQFRLQRAPVDVMEIMEDAVTNAAVQFREKGLNVVLSIEDNLPMPYADEDAVKQMIAQLLTNAYLVSPPESEISVTLGRRDVILSRDLPQAKAVDCLLISVEDRGGGILPEDEARVFTRKYRAENPLIVGLGDTGVGLAIAKILAEAHQGRLWLESVENVGTTFNIVLPVEELPEVAGA